MKVVEGVAESSRGLSSVSTGSLNIYRETSFSKLIGDTQQN